MKAHVSQKNNSIDFIDNYIYSHILHYICWCSHIDLSDASAQEACTEIIRDAKAAWEDACLDVPEGPRCELIYNLAFARESKSVPWIVQLYRYIFSLSFTDPHWPNTCTKWGYIYIYYIYSFCKWDYIYIYILYKFLGSTKLHLISFWWRKDFESSRKSP